MNITKREGTENQNADYKKYVGVSLWEVVAINPDKEKLGELLGTDKIEKDPEYLGETKDGDTIMKFSFWLKSTINGALLPLRFSIIDKEKVSQSGKTQYINQVGMTSYVDHEANLQNWFTHFTDKEKNPIEKKKYRKALVGEEDFYSFLRSWIVKGNYYDPQTDILLDIKKLFRGKIDDLLLLQGSELVEPVVALATVRIVDTDDGQKEYNQIYPRASLPGWKWKNVKGSLSTGKWNDDKGLKAFNEAITGEFGCRDLYIMKELMEYNPEQFQAAGNDTLVAGDDMDTSY